MYKYLTKNGQSLALGLGVLVVVIFLINVYTGFSAAGYDMSTDLNKLPKPEKAGISFFNVGLAITMAMVVISFLLAFVVFGIADLVKFPKNAIKFLIGVIGLAVVFFALYATSTMEVTGRMPHLNDTFNITENISKFISGGIKTTMGLLAFSAIAIIVGEVWSILK